MRRLFTGLSLVPLLLQACSTTDGVSAAAPLRSGWPACGRAETFPGPSWGLPAPPPGWDAARLAEAEDLFESLDSAAVMVVHRGRLVAAWGSVEKNYTAQSVRKALLSSLAGIAVGQGRLETSDTLAELGIDDTRPALTEKERQATLRDLLMSRSGIFHSALYEVGGWKRIRGQLAEIKPTQPERFRPGAYWVYNNWDFNALGTIVEKAFARPLGALFADLVAGPIGMEDFAPGNVGYTAKTDATEQRFGNWSEHRAYVFDISTRDLARYGLLYLNCGDWDGRRVVPRAWVLESLDGIDTSNGRGPDEQDTRFGDYGYLWQIERPGSRRLVDLPTREPIYSATGNRGHFMIVAPYLDLVIAHQVATEGGVAMEAQRRRAIEGSPEVSEEDLTRLFAAIIAAHPDAAAAWEPASAPPGAA